jgi:hypothetical protein
MTPAAYARSRGFSRQYIGRCLDLGLIHRAVVTVNGRRLLDPEVADEEMADNRPDATSGCWHEARGLSRPRPRPQNDSGGEATATLIDTALVPFVLDLADRMAHSAAVMLREDGALAGGEAVRLVELGFAVGVKHLAIMLDRPDLKIELPDFIRRLGDPTQRAALVAALDARPPHPPADEATRGRTRRVKPPR